LREGSLLAKGRTRLFVAGGQRPFIKGRMRPFVKGRRKPFDKGGRGPSVQRGRRPFIERGGRPSVKRSRRPFIGRGRPFIEETIHQGKEEAVYWGRKLFVDLQVGPLFNVVHKEEQWISMLGNSKFNVMSEFQWTWTNCSSWLEVVHTHNCRWHMHTRKLRTISKILGIDIYIKGMTMLILTYD
jgi:hypothetical protein